MASEHVNPVLKIFSRFTFHHINAKIPKITYTLHGDLGPQLPFNLIYHSPFTQLAPDVMASWLCFKHPRILPALAVPSASLKALHMSSPCWNPLSETSTLVTLFTIATVPLPTDSPSHFIFLNGNCYLLMCYIVHLFIMFIFSLPS